MDGGMESRRQYLMFGKRKDGSLYGEGDIDLESPSLKRVSKSREPKNIFFISNFRF